MKDFSITRIPNNDLIGLLFPPIVSLSEYEIEVIRPEYIKGFYVSSATGNSSALSTRQYAIVDLSDYDYALIPTQCSATSWYTSGIREDANSGAFPTHAVHMYPSIAESATAWGLFSNFTQYPYGLINTEIDNDLPVIAFRRHRSDNVNPRSPQRPEPIEIRERQESEPEPLPEIAEPDVEETPEEVEEE